MSIPVHTYSLNCYFYAMKFPQSFRLQRQYKPLCMYLYSSCYISLSILFTVWKMWRRNRYFCFPISIIIRLFLRINTSIIQGMENVPVSGRIAETLCLTLPQELNSNRAVFSRNQKLTSLMTRYLVLYGF